jgi:3-phenylpropionate/trans-cinnamate dioxygenase ferredoxin reductase subunit
MGKQCTLVMLEPAPLCTGFGDAVGRFFEGVLRARGIELVTGDALAGFEGEGRVARVLTESGRSLDADMVVMGTGVMPDVMLARSAGLELGATGGVACSSSLETSVPGIWAAGDTCEYESVLHGRRVRIEHWEVALAQGKAVAAAVAGRPADFAEVPYFWSDLADWCTLEYVGPAESWDREVVRGSFDDGKFTVFYLSGDRLAAALTVGRPEDLMHAHRLLAARTDLAGRGDALADASADLAEL